MIGLSKRMRRSLAPEKLATIAVALVALCVYGLTSAPSYSWGNDSADGGDLIAASVTGGVPHPSGYPTYLLLTSPLRLIPWGEVGYRFNMLSGLCAATSVLLTGLSLQLVLIGQQSAATDQNASPSVHREWQAALIGSTAGMLAFSPTMWSQAVTAEVYALHATFTAALVWLLLQWRRAVTREQHSRTNAMLAAVGLVAGLGLGNHLTLSLLLPGAVVFVWSTARRQGWTRRRSNLAWLSSLGGLLLGLSVYMVLPLRAAGNPPINWGQQTL